MVSKDKIQIVVVDDHPVVLEGMVRLIEQEKDLCVCAQCEDAPEALEAITRTDPDLAVIDLSLKSHDGLELIKDLQVRFPELPVLVVSMHQELIYAERALKAGAKGYLMKSEATEEIIKAIRRIMSGKTYLSDKMNSVLMEKYIAGGSAGASPLDRLTDRELEVFERIGRGFATKEIAEALTISIKTVESHRLHILEKLNLNNSRELFQYALQWFQDTT